MSKKITGVVFYEGPSLIDGQPIIGIATFGTANEKTGNLVQTWIIRSDIHPIDAINTGADASICGNCPLRGRIADVAERIHESKFGGETTNKGRSCYVLVQNAPAAIYLSYKKGQYPKLSAEHRRKMIGKGLRYGSYGDPVAIPLKSWDALATYCTGKAAPGYTHQWRDERFSGWAKRVMASTHSVEENVIAAEKGWRTFRTAKAAGDVAANEIVCPASEEGGYTQTCETCGACNGRRDMKDKRKSLVIVAHGSSGKQNFVAKVIDESTKRFSLPMIAA